MIARPHVAASPAGARLHAGRVTGFTLIEVLISLVILGFGLLGLGLLQASSLKASFSANHRTVATNLAYELIDMVRAKRVQAYQFGDISAADFPKSPGCSRQVYPSTANLAADDIAAWECKVSQDLPGATATVTYPFVTPGAMRVVITWSDQRFLAQYQGSTFTMVSQP